MKTKSQADWHKKKNIAEACLNRRTTQSSTYDQVYKLRHVDEMSVTFLQDIRWTNCKMNKAKYWEIASYLTAPRPTPDHLVDVGSVSTCQARVSRQGFRLQKAYADISICNRE